MKFLVIILVIRLVAVLLTRKGDTNEAREETTIKRTVFHPSEYELR